MSEKDLALFDNDALIGFPESAFRAHKMAQNWGRRRGQKKMLVTLYSWKWTDFAARVGKWKFVCDISYGTTRLEVKHSLELRNAA